MAVGVIAVVLVLAAAALWLGRGVTPSVAVLPFVDLSSDKNQEYFTDGLTEELLNGLARTPGLRIAGRTSSFQFKGKTGNFPVIGKKLNVQAVLEGSVRTQGNQVRIAVQLIKAADGFPLWAQTYNRELNDIFAVEEDIARAVTAALKVRLLGGMAPAKSTNAEAYKAYLLGRYFLVRNYKENLQKAIFYFDQATKLDAGYAPAWVGLGWESPTVSRQRMATFLWRRLPEGAGGGGAGAGPGTRESQCDRNVWVSG